MAVFPRFFMFFLSQSSSKSLPSSHCSRDFQEERVRKTVGILESPVVPPSEDRELTCGICFDSYPPAKIASVSCGHPFCTTCWTWDYQESLGGLTESTMQENNDKNLYFRYWFVHESTYFCIEFDS